MNPQQLILTLLPFYFVIFLGYIGGHFLKIDLKTIAKLVIYLITPVIIFNGVYRINLSLSTLSIPLLIYCICTITCLLFYAISSLVWQDAHRNILAVAAPWGNIGYLGLPVAIAILGEGAQGIVVLAIVGVEIFMATVGLYLIALGNYHPKMALIKTLRMPYLPTFLLGLLFNSAHLELGTGYNQLIVNFRGAYTITGMMIIGLGMVNIKKISPDLPFILITFFGKFFIFPVLFYLVIIWDKNHWQIYQNYTWHQETYPTLIYQTLMLISLAPIGANIVALAAEFDLYPEKAATVVVLSTLFAIVYLPLLLPWLGF